MCRVVAGTILGVARDGHPGGRRLVVRRRELGGTRLLFTQIGFQCLSEQGPRLVGRKACFEKSRSLGKSLYLSVQFPHLKNEDYNSIYLLGLLWGINVHCE